MEIKWEVYEYEYSKKSPDWFWSLWIISIAIIFLSIKFYNPLFAILIFIGAFTMSLQAVRKPDLLKIEINPKGVIINKKIFPYQNLDYYSIKEEDGKRLIIQPKNKLIPILTIPLGEKDIHQIKKTLSLYIKEGDVKEPILHKFAKYF